ncbi:MAG: ABC transporter permease [Dehalococcoidia bacterium]|mgnify:FL=1|jgi:peptide/nickel transport system permease protein|nr:ABC transporter permease [Dehalococcoidia bacterium]MCH2519774.1 ABC transporter permease [Dehalococcoidia bacterium]
MQRFLVRRFFISIITLLVVSVVIFAMSRASGDPRHIFLDDYSTQEDWDRLTVSLGLDKPYYQQYGIFLTDAMQGNFGISIKEKRPVVDIIGERVVATIQLGGAAFLFSIGLGLPLGVLSAVKRGSLLDAAGKLVALVGQSAPNFWLGIMLMFFFAVNLGWLPAYGRQEKLSIILPAVTLGWYYVAANLRLIRSSMLDALDSEYIKLARAKGVKPAVVIWKHALRNALVPALTFAGVTLGALVTGSLVVETVFAWPGLGQLAVQALFAADYPLLQGVVMVFTMLYVAAALGVDVLYAYIDPRIRYT